MTEHDPFAALGLPPRAGLSDDEVRAAWRRIAAATHPDRGDGGDPARFGAAAAAYALLRTAYGRGEALADLGPLAGSRTGRDRRARRGPRRRPGRHSPDSGNAGPAVWWRRRIGRRAGVLALRAAAACAVGGGAFGVAGWTPASIGVLAGALTWLIATGRHDIAPAARE